MLQKYLLVFLVSMVPMIELRGAVLLAPGLDLPMLPSYIVCILGNMLPVPFIYLFARKVLTWGAGKPVIGRFFQWCLVKGHRGGEKLRSKAGRGLFLALMLFVAIPVPGTAPGPARWPPAFWIWSLSRRCWRCSPAWPLPG